MLLYNSQTVIIVTQYSTWQYYFSLYFHTMQYTPELIQNMFTYYVGISTKFMEEKSTANTFFL